MAACEMFGQYTDSLATISETKWKWISCSGWIPTLTAGHDFIAPSIKIIYPGWVMLPNLLITVKSFFIWAVFHIPLDISWRFYDILLLCHTSQWFIIDISTFESTNQDDDFQAYESYHCETIYFCLQVIYRVTRVESEFFNGGYFHTAWSDFNESCCQSGSALCAIWFINCSNLQLEQVS